jgi:hypothetical protein
LVEQPIRNRQVIGSSPIVGSILTSSLPEAAQQRHEAFQRTFSPGSVFRVGVKAIKAIV